MDPSAWILLLTLWLPALAAVVLACAPTSAERFARVWIFLSTLAVFVLVLLGYLLPGSPARFDVSTPTLQHVLDVPWLPSFDIRFAIGLDGISFPLVVLSALIAVLAAAASRSITKGIKAYGILFLLLQTGILGVFLAQDFFLFYVFWEAMLLPMYFLIGIWGGPRKEYAAIKFFLYTLVGGVLMLVALLVLYFQSDVRALADSAVTSTSAAETLAELAVDPESHPNLGVVVVEDPTGARALLIRRAWEPERELTVVRGVARPGAGPVGIFSEARGVVEVLLPAEPNAADLVQAIEENPLLAQALDAALLLPPANGAEVPAREIAGSATAWLRPAPDDVMPVASFPPRQTLRPIHTFSLPLLADLALETECFSPTVQRWCFLALFLGFLIKLPGVPFHTWLPDAHVEAPTPISMILAGVLLKMGGYGLIRVAFPLCPFGAHEYAWLVAGLGIVSMFYGALAAMAQKDFKRLVAYSSVSHMGYVLLGLGAWSASVENGFDASYWNMGAQGAMFQMLAHGISSAGMFFVVGVLYDRVKHRDLDEFGGVYGRMPALAALAFGIFFAGLGLPGLCGFWGEVFVVFSAWKYHAALAVAGAFTTVLTAAYVLTCLQKVFLGAEYRGPYSEKLVPLTLREFLIAGTLFTLGIAMGVAPHPLGFRWFDATFDRQYARLAAWTERLLPVYEAREARELEAQRAAANARAESERAAEGLSMGETPVDPAGPEAPGEEKPSDVPPSGVAPNLEGVQEDLRRKADPPAEEP
ncbi:MAG TPA: NADH-quinone oxidoreductase subunit M [Pirellulaceae bacterium]|jgi:NADH-quinone oxidoreductase subunit M|nr:NADH-quinone oxidoreductase subunit M [Pirellulaceae bacterium]